MTSAITDERWMQAQRVEAKWWREYDWSRLLPELHHFYMDQMEITPERIAGLSILDLGGGPMPLALRMNLPVGSLTVVDPLSTLYNPPPEANVMRLTMTAEDYRGPQVDEVWGYNVLQHVIEPAAVLTTAKMHATRVRWFDWVDTRIEGHHPHSINADWLRDQFADWRLVSETRSRVAAHQQSFIAIVAERS